jgi:hypothetical protein
MKNSSPTLLTRLARAGVFAPVLALLTLFAPNGGAAPIITSIVETGGDNEPTDTITAKWTGQTFPISVAGEPFPGAVIGNNYTVPAWGAVQPAYVDRAHHHTNAAPAPMPTYLLGGEYIMSGNDNRDNATYLLDVTISQPARVYLLIDNRLGDTVNATPPTFDATHMQWVLDQGWTPVITGLNHLGLPAVPDETGIDEGADGTINNYFSIYTRVFPAGTFQLRQADNTGQNMYAAVVTPYAPGGYSAAVRADGPIAYWRFNNDTAPTANNLGSLGPTANGTYMNGAASGAEAPRPPAFIGFEAGNTALQLDGVDDFVASAAGMLNGLPNITMSGWIRRAGNQNNRTGLFGQNDVIEFGYIDNGTMQTWVDNFQTPVNVPTPFPDLEWDHVAVVIDGANLRMTTYTNGQVAGTAPLDSSTYGNNSNPFVVGGDSFGQGVTFNGQLDEVAVFDKALTVAQIAAQYAAAFTDVAFTFRNCQKPPGTTLFSGTDTTADAVPGTPSNGRGYIGDDGTGTNCVLHLTDPVGSSFGAWLIPDQASGNNVDHLKVNWRSRIGGGASGGADGYSFNWATDLPNPPTYGNPGEDGAGSGLRVAVDTFDNGDPGGDVGIEIRWQGVRVGFTAVPKDNPGNGIYLRKDTFVDAEFEIETSGAAHFNYDGNVVSAQISDWHGIAGGNYMFGGRTGGANDNQWIDDVLITVFPPTAPFITQQPADVTLRQGLNATFNVTVIGSEPLNYQWLRKLTTDADFVPIADSNTNRYTTPPLVFPDDDNSLFKVQVNNTLGMVESRAALVHVLSDTNPPTILSSAGSGDFMHATILFSEELDLGTAQDPFNYAFSGGLGVNSAVLSADRRSVTLTTDLQTPDTLYTIIVNNVADLANLPIAPDSMTTYRTWTTGPCNGVLFEAYGDIGGTAVSDLTSAPNFPNNPRDVALITTLDSRLVYADDSHENYGGRMRGVFFPRESGLHTFYLAADDNAELWLSTDLSPANKVRIARETAWSNTKEWTASAGGSDVNAKKSVPINLVGGQPYYIEALYKEGGGGDHCSVAVQTPIDPGPPMNGSGEIPAALLGSPNAPAGFAGAITITTPPADQTAVQCRSATFSVVASNPNSLPMCHQWQLNGTDIPGANHSSYTTPPTQLSDEGALYTVNITMFGGASASASARLHVTADRTPPDCPMASGVSALNQVILMFNEVLDQTSAENTANYSIAGVTVVSAVLDASKTKVTLTVSPLLPTGATLSVAVHGVADCSGNAVAACSASFQTWQLRYGGGRREIYTGIGGTAVSDLTGNGKYPNSPDVVNFAEFLEGPIDLQISDGGGTGPSIADSYGERVSGYLVPPVTGNYNFFISSDDNSEFWLSTDDSPANKVLICREPAWATIRNWTDSASGRRSTTAPENQSTTLFPTGLPLTAGGLYYFEAIHKEGGGGDNLDVTWQTPAGGPQPGVPVNASFGDATPPNGLPGGTKPVPGRYLATLVPPGFDTTAPTILACKQLSPRNRLVVYFSEIMRSADAENLGNYSVPGSTLTSAALRQDQRSVELLTLADVPSGSTLTVNNLKDGVGNSIAAGTTVPISAVQPFLAAGAQNIIAFEAEHFADRETPAGLQPWSVLTTEAVVQPASWQNNLGAVPLHPVGSGYSGEGFVEVILDGWRKFHQNTPDLFIGFGARADYLVNFPVAGTYYIWVRGSTFDGSFNSFHMGLDGVSPGDNVQRIGNAVNNWGGNATDFGWVNSAQSAPARIDVAAPGLHIINIWPREDGTRIDKFVFTTDAAFTPGTGTGPAESQNDCPVATASSISVMQDSQGNALQLQASDADGDALTYQITQPPAHGVLVVASATGAATYTPNAGYCGPDSFKFRVTDGQCNSQEATVSINVVCLNRCPTACITTIALCTEIETNTFISPNGSNACFVLDASCSVDPDGDALTYSWFADGSVVPFAAGVRVTNCFDLGGHTILLLVDDGRCSDSHPVTVDVLTGCEAVEALVAKVNDASLSRANKRPLIATLKAACASFERGSFESAVGQLGAFVNKVRAQIGPANPDEAALFIRCAQSIIDSVNCEEASGP